MVKLNEIQCADVQCVCDDPENKQTTHITKLQ